MPSYDPEHREKYDIRLYNLKQAHARGEINKDEYSAQKRNLDRQAGLAKDSSTRLGSIKDFFTMPAPKKKSDVEDKQRKDVSEPETQQKPQIVYPPGYSTEKILRFLLSERDFVNVFEPVLTDMRIAYFDAILANDETRAKWVAAREHIRMLWVFILFLGLAGWTRQIKKLMEKLNDGEESDEDST